MCLQELIGDEIPECDVTIILSVYLLPLNYDIDTHRMIEYIISGQLTD